MANQTQDLNDLLDARDDQFSLDLTQKIARLPVFSDNQHVSLPVYSQLGYFACLTLRNLATAKDEVLWEIYGDIISNWPGSTAQGIQKSRKDQFHWVQAYRSKMDPGDMERTISNIRKALATVKLEVVLSHLLPAFARHVSADIEELKHAIALHWHSKRNENTIFILPFLPTVEGLIATSCISPGMGFLPGHDMDVVIVTTAKAMVHESRHMVGTLVSV